MKTRSIVVCVLFFVSLTASAQTKYGVEFVGGMNYGGLNTDRTVRSPSAFTGGIGVVMNVDRQVEIVGSTLFTYFPPSKQQWSPPLLAPEFIPDPYAVYPPDRNAYSCEILVGPRFNGHGSSFVHPFLVVQGGMQLLRMVEQAGYYGLPVPQDRAVTQFLNMHGTEDVQLRGVINVGGGVRFIPSQSIRLMLQASYKLMIGRESSIDTFIPVTLSVLLPV